VEALTEKEAEAMTLVTAGYYRVRSAFMSAKQWGAAPRGKLMAEVIDAGEWTPPHLLDDVRLEKLTALLPSGDSHSMLAFIWHVLETECDENRLVPALVIDRETGHLVARLMLL